MNYVLHKYVISKKIWVGSASLQTKCFEEFYWERWVTFLYCLFLLAVLVFWSIPLFLLCLLFVAIISSFHYWRVVIKVCFRMSCFINNNETCNFVAGQTQAILVSHFLPHTLPTTNNNWIVIIIIIASKHGLFLGVIQSLVLLSTW